MAARLFCRFGDAHGCPGPTEETILSATPFRALITTTALLAALAPATAGCPAEAAPRSAIHQPVTTARAVDDLLVLRAAGITRATRSTRTTVLPHRLTARSSALRRQVVLQRRAGRYARARVRVVAYARAQRGDWYQYGAQGPSRWDCSGLTRGSMAVVGVRLAHSSRAQARRGTRVAAHNARPGDLVVYGGHVGILSGKWRMVDAPGSGRRVVERAVYHSRSLQFRRVIG